MNVIIEVFFEEMVEKITSNIETYSNQIMLKKINIDNKSYELEIEVTQPRFSGGKYHIDLSLFEDDGQKKRISSGIGYHKELRI